MERGDDHGLAFVVPGGIVQHHSEPDETSVRSYDVGMRPFSPRQRHRGEPRSANGASSMHLWWQLPGRLLEVAATLEVVVPPAVPRLFFWALQVGFDDGRRLRGAAHLGLQAHPSHPGGTAVNWGGYRAAGDGGGELAGSTSRLPSATDNPNTRDFPWVAQRPYRLRIVAPGLHRPSRWRGEVTDLATGMTTLVRHLDAPGRFLVQPVVWSEVFARCDHPTTAVRWSDLRARTPDNRELTPTGVRVSYQSGTAGGCDNTTAILDGEGVVQVTNVERRIRPGTAITWPPEAGPAQLPR